MSTLNDFPFLFYFIFTYLFIFKIYQYFMRYRKYVFFFSYNCVVYFELTEKNGQFYYIICVLFSLFINLLLSCRFRTYNYSSFTYTLFTIMINCKTILLRIAGHRPTQMFILTLVNAWCSALMPWSPTDLFKCPVCKKLVVRDN